MSTHEVQASREDDLNCQAVISTDSDRWRSLSQDYAKISRKYASEMTDNY